METYNSNGASLHPAWEKSALKREHVYLQINDAIIHIMCQNVRGKTKNH